MGERRCPYTDNVMTQMATIGRAAGSRARVTLSPGRQCAEAFDSVHMATSLVTNLTAVSRGQDIHDTRHSQQAMCWALHTVPSAGTEVQSAPTPKPACTASWRRRARASYKQASPVAPAVELARSDSFRARGSAEDCVALQQQCPSTKDCRVALLSCDRLRSCY
jgi:hypothetical protein